MKNNKKLLAGIADPLTIGIIVVILLAVGFLLYFSVSRKPVDTDLTLPEISESDEIEVMEEELEAIDLGEFDEEIESLNQEASSL